MFYGLAKRLRNQRVLPHITADDTHLDIGCGDGWLLRHSPAETHNGILGQGKTQTESGREIETNAERVLPGLMAEVFTKITLVAVLEHVDDPALVMRECCRLLAPAGQILITAPTRTGHWLTPLVSWHDFKEHKRVITFKSLRAITPPDWKITRKFFELGLNQLFIVERA